MSAIIEESILQTQEKSNALLDHISSTPSGRKWLHSIKVQLHPVPTNGADDDTSKLKILDGFNQSLGVSGTYSSAVFYVYVQIPCHGNVNARFQGQIGGLYTPNPITPVFGTLYYDDPNQVKTSTSCETAQVSAWTPINLFDRNTNIVGTFQLAGIPGVGLGGGTCSWTPL